MKTKKKYTQVMPRLGVDPLNADRDEQTNDSKSKPSQK